MLSFTVNEIAPGFFGQFGLFPSERQTNPGIPPSTFARLSPVRDEEIRPRAQ